MRSNSSKDDKLLANLPPFSVGEVSLTERRNKRYTWKHGFKICLRAAKITKALRNFMKETSNEIRCLVSLRYWVSHNKHSDPDDLNQPLKILRPFDLCRAADYP